MKQITIIDYGSGNVLSAQKSFIKVASENNIEANVIISKNLNDIRNSTHIVLPGQGAFSTCIAEIKKTKGLIDELHNFAIIKQKPFLGTILNILTIGNVLDLTMYFIPTPESIMMRHGYLYFGTVLFAMGVGIYIGSGLGPGPRDGIMTGIAKRGPSVRVTRIAIDFTAFVSGVLLGGSYGYGTIFMVLIVGPIVQFSLKRYDKGAIFSLK